MYSVYGAPSLMATPTLVVAPPSPSSKAKNITSCTGHLEHVPFTLQEATDFISKFCTADLSKPVADGYVLKAVKLELIVDQSQDQIGFQPNNDQFLTKDECTQYFLPAVNGYRFQLIPKIYHYLESFH